METMLKLVRPTEKRTADRRILYLYECRCGNTVLLPKKVVNSGNTKSCGCWKSKVSADNVRKVQHLAAKAASTSNRKHGMHGTRFYRIWRSMLNRCADKSNKYYGGRGINVCNRWRDFNGFHEDMYESYIEHCREYGDSRAGTSIDRIDNDKGYSPSNCRWATAKMQALNQRRMSSIQVEGIDQNVTM